MNFQEIQNEALHLPERDRAELAQSLLFSLDSFAEDRVSIDWPTSSEEVHRKGQSTDVTFLRGLEGTLGEWASEADEEASREAVQKLLHKTRGSMKLGKTPEDVDAEIRIMRDEWERTWE